MMERRTPRLFLALAAVVALALLAAACGDDDSEQTLEEYFTELESAFDQIAADSMAIEREHPQSFRDLGQTQDYYEALLSEIGPAYDEFGEMTPPEEAAEEHEALVQTTQGFLAEARRVSDELQELEGSAELAEYVSDLRTDPAFTLALTNVADACAALQRRADASRVDVNLRCGETSNPAENVVLEQYLTAVRDIFGEANEAAGDAVDQVSEAVEGAEFEEQKEAIDTYLTDIEGVFENTVTRLRALGTPDAVLIYRDSFIGAVEDMIQSAAAFQADLSTIEGGEELDERRAEFGEEIESAITRADSACRQMQRTGEGRGIYVDLMC